ncbi:MAG: hypothetical protein A2048_09560 [Deltaproteobacteria bacterium GWA2_45_12]|nr:MAG: hypothetical protein A2048_09560 [Deltaproteobacteria bacterium GWA2_45_12]
MVGIVLISENSEAFEMLKTVQRLLGKPKGIVAVKLKPGDTIIRMRKQLQDGIQKVSHKKGVLLLTHFYGSTQCNVCLEFVHKGVVELVSGFNLPMLVKLLTLHKTVPLKKLVPFIAQYGRTHIYHVQSKKMRVCY